MSSGTIFHGLFIGVDNYKSPEFRRLKFAQRDAIVLRALFLDNFAGKANLVLGPDATKDRILTEIRHIAETSTDDDIVVITFAGHGTRTHELATYDTVPDRLAETSLPLRELHELIETIPARLLLVVLDCCFSGGLLDRILWRPESGYTSRSEQHSAEEALSRILGRGRVVLTASTRDDQAYENNELGHGLLSHYLITALLGDRNVLENDDEISVIKLVDYVSRNVGSHEPGLSGKRQRPTFGGSLDNLRLPVLKRGPRYHETRDDETPPPVTTALSSLQRHGIPADLVRVWKKQIPTLNRIQVEAVNRAGLLTGNNVLVSAPTSSGKTLIGEIAALKAVSQGSKAVFLLPTRALVNEQYERFVRTYRPVGVRTIRATGELRDQVCDLLKGDFDVAVLTYEKFIGLLSGHPGLLAWTGVLVVDEIQSLMLPERGPLLEMMFTWIGTSRTKGRVPQVIGLSAVIGDPEELGRWLGADVVRTTERQVPLIEGVVGPDGRYRYRDQDGDESTRQLLDSTGTADDDLVSRLVEELVSTDQQVIVFRAKRDDARSLASRLARSLGQPPADTVLAQLPRGDAGRANDLLRECLAGGVAFHISDLGDDGRLLEQSFRQPGSEVRVLVATTTLAQGVNFPADSVVICELDHPTGDRKYSVVEYKNMAGRAGRAKLGHSFIVTEGGVDAERKWRDYVLAESEAVRSALLSPLMDLRTLILTAFAGPAADFGVSSESDVERFLSWTLAAHQRRATRSPNPFPPEDIRSAMAELVRADLLRRPDTGFSLTRLGEIVVGRCLGADSVAAVAEALAAVPPDGLNRMTLICAAQLAEELQDTRFSQRTRRWRKEHKSFTEALKGQLVAEPVLTRLMGDPDPGGAGTARARRSIACLLWSQGVGLAKIEKEITIHLPPGKNDAGPVRQATQRAADVMHAVIDIACHVHPTADLGDLAELLPAQLELGITKDLVPIARHTEENLERGVYLALDREGFSGAQAVLDADEARLLQCVGGNQDSLRLLRDAAAAAKAEADQVDLPDLLPPPVD